MAVANEHSSPWLQAGRLAFIALCAITVLAAGRWALSNVREVKPTERALVVRMGALQRVQNAGLLLAWPNPFEQVLILPSAETVLERHVEALLRSKQALQADMNALDDDEGEPVGDALAGSGYLLTGDAGVVQLDVRVFYKVTDAFEYALQGEHVIPALDRLVTRSAVAVCAGRDLDTILVARPELLGSGNEDAEKRERLRSDLLQGINERLAAMRASGMGLGIELTRVDVQSSLPRDTLNAFNAVLTASQLADQNIADARTDAERTTQTATQAADRSLQIAQALASERLSKAQADTFTVLRLSQAMKDHVEPGLLARVYRERMPGILSKAGSVTTVNPKDDSRLIIQGADK